MDKNLLSPARGRVLGRVLESRERGMDFCCAPAKALRNFLAKPER
jgi:hypothetical protein